MLILLQNSYLPNTTVLIADSGATKAEWCLVSGNKKKTLLTQGISPYFLSTAQIAETLSKELLPQIKKEIPGSVYYYGTGCANPDNARSVKKAIQSLFKDAHIEVNHDLMA